jgi:beta-lactam-binding protein with PASTA domain
LGDSALTRFFARPFFVALLLWTGVGLAVYLIVDFVGMPYLAGKFTGTVHVPAVVGAKPDQAKSLLEQNHLEYKVDSLGEFSADIPKGKILSQYPLSGTEVKKGRRVWVKISKGSKRIELPALRGLSQHQAEISLQQLGLRLGHIRMIRTTSIPAGAVIGTYPPAHTALPRGRAVDIEVSEGENDAPTEMVSLTGLSLSQAKRQIKQAGLTVGNITYQKSARSLPNTVLSQNPAAGSPLNGAPVDLTVSK